MAPRYGLPVTSPELLPERFSRVLADFIAARRIELSALDSELAALTDVLEPLISGGKRLRPVFAYWGAIAAGGTESDELFAAASALELVQMSALIHDDLIDGSDTRRGVPAAHKAFASLADSEHFGEGAAVLLGDLCLSWADQLFFESGMPAERLLAAKPYFDVMRTEVAGGQYLDLLEQHRGDATPARVNRVMELKSAKYTIERPLHIGAALAGAGPDLFDGLTAYALPLGRAFQLRDDLLGVFGDASVTGKPAGDDLREGKRTLLVVRALELLEPTDAQWLRSALGTPMSDSDIARAQNLLTDCGVVAEIEALIAAELSTALAAIDSTSMDARAASALRDLGVAAAHRSR